ncbi:MAG: hypothetical protein AVDCRST_MAG93-8542 [uncultured Chloroflexia bacterium]|uniref:Uncharacterized protein n=1 Tax=uncultured Chloroflexia bacterium TaxID=1672391 RepID=A0A6J4MYS2_9CHLR|nr:MAG: hypothetical protein AVDCRST_MAG93-8542 [uncultured Chloroflexia bacterium]
MPALFTSTSTGPSSRVTVSSIRSDCAGSVTSSSTAMARPPLSLMLAATCSERSRLRAAIAISAPTSASAWTKASPSPWFPPVTTATLPSRRKESSRAIGPPFPQIYAASNPPRIVAHP